MTTDLDSAVRRLAHHTDPAGDPIRFDELTDPTRRSTRHRGRTVLGIAAAVTLVAILGSAIAIVSSDDDDATVTARASDPGGEGPNAELVPPGQIRAVSESPLAGRSDAATAWTGSEVFIWGGDGDDGVVFADGATYDPQADSWAPLPESPLSARSSATATWTGTEVIVWGGSPPTERSAPPAPSTSPPAEPSLGDGAAFSPATRTWRTISEAPVTSAGRAQAVWTGDEVIVLAGFNRAEGAAYDPTNDTWREIAAPPGPLVPPTTQAIWAGDQLVAPLHDADGSDPATRFDRIGLFAYDPLTDEWGPLGDPPRTERSQVVWTGSDVVDVPVSAGAAAIWDRRSGDFIDIDAGPAPWRPTQGAISAVWTGSTVLVWTPQQLTSLDIETGTWATSEIDDPPDPVSREGASIAWVDGVLFVWGGFSALADGFLARAPQSGQPGQEPSGTPSGSEASEPSEPTEVSASLVDGLGIDIDLPPDLARYTPTTWGASLDTAAVAPSLRPLTMTISQSTLTEWLATRPEATTRPLTDSPDGPSIVEPAQPAGAQLIWSAGRWLATVTIPAGTTDAPSPLTEGLSSVTLTAAADGPRVASPDLPLTNPTLTLSDGDITRELIITHTPCTDADDVSTPNPAYFLQRCFPAEDLLAILYAVDSSVDDLRVSARPR